MDHAMALNPRRLPRWLCECFHRYPGPQVRYRWNPPRRRL
eukprot:SAG31_NODE_7217_length_1752_cov_12.118572_3_plen_39_part_01